MVRRGLIEKIYAAASMQRWNDHVRPVELTELDKQSHKLVIAYVIAKSEEDSTGKSIDWQKLVRGFLFEFFQRVVLTDLKPPLFHEVEAAIGRELNSWVLEELSSDISELEADFVEDFQKYLLEPDKTVKERRILEAAHYLASQWEFKIVYHVCPFMYGIEETKEDIEKKVDKHIDLVGVEKLLSNRKLLGFIDLCGQLRFQKRWAQTPRIPGTSVLGHMLVVSILSYLFSLGKGFCEKRVFNDTFSGLFHDLPEVLTRDIVSPVKGSVEKLKEIIEKYEREQFEKRIIPLLPESFHEEIRFFLNKQWSNRIMDNGEAIYFDGDIPPEYNENDFRPVDGKMLKACDEFAAFVEASMSLSHGIRSHHFTEAMRKWSEEYKSRIINGINFGQLFDYFKHHY